ncbi:hypothetical protein [Nocardioides terrisoli]|uniref:hypothetical protein n=1 Tax=Nocardioides terrisoli TaxID=3388267 RepID=UPI00287B7798|nr:hypothetical protein [Nocardioides marmorisolisilvae]
MADQPDPDRDLPAGDQDSVWREIVANYGEPALKDDLTGQDWDRALDRSQQEARAQPEPDPPATWVDEPQEHYVPPPPPPAPRPTGPRGAAWIALFGSPSIALVCILLRISLPSWASLLLFCAFVGGFGYLVATMRKGDDDDPWDDGAVV